MEDWQRECINTHLDQLCYNTICSKTLITKLIEFKVITEHDQSSVETKAGRYEKSSSLYGILKTRTNGFQGIMKALQQTNQDGALKILQKACADKGEIGDTDINPESQPTDEKWETSLISHKKIFFAQTPCKEAVEVLVRRFYTEEMDNYLKHYKNYRSDVLIAYHKQISKFMIDIYKRLACKYKSNFVAIDSILSMCFKEVKTRHSISLNGNLHFIVENIAIGIDLGTCNLCVAVCNQGKVKIIPNDAGETTTPSYVSFEQNGTMVVGKFARKHAFKNPIFTIFDSKRMIGRTKGGIVL